MQTTSYNKTELLIFGYISSIKRLLDDETIIPDEICKLCILFYARAISILWSRIKWNIADPIGNDFFVLDIDKDKSVRIKTERLNDWVYERDEDIFMQSQNFKYKKEILDGVFTLVTKPMRSFIKGRHRYPPAFPYLCLYDPYTKETKYEYLSSKSLEHNIMPKQFLYLQNKQTMIYQHDKKLYELKMDVISQDDDLCKFIEIESGNEIDIELSFKVSGRRRLIEHHWLQMVYLPKQESIFAVNCFFIRSRLYEQNKSVQIAPCRLFNINERKWINIEDYKYETEELNWFDITSLFYHDIDDRVYMIDNRKKDLSYFDLYKQKWNVLRRECKVENEVLWIDNKILYGVQTTNHEEWKFTMNTLDLRDKDDKWMSNYKTICNNERADGGFQFHQYS